MRTIIVIAYQLHYSRGSECSVAMNYVRHMSKNNRLIVLYGSSGEHHQIGNTREMEEWCKNNTIPNVTFVPVKPSFEAIHYDYSLKGIRGFYREYRKWHRDVLNVVQELLKTHKVDIVHFLGPIGYHEPGYLYNFPVPYIWGPVGGFGGANPLLLRATCSLKGAFHMLVKRCVNAVQALTDRRVRKALRDSDVIICATTEYRRTITKLAGKRHHSIIFYRAENCLTDYHELNEDKFSAPIRLAFVGRIDENKGLIFLLKALYKLGKDTEIHLDVVGEDRLNGKMQYWAERHGISNMITWYGQVPREKVFEIINNSHLIAITSLHEGNPTIVWEAMSVGTPILTLDYKGMHDTVSDKSGFKIKAKTYSQIINDIAEALKEVQNNKAILRDKALALLDERQKYSWEEREKFFEKMYVTAENQYEIRRR